MSARAISPVLIVDDDDDLRSTLADLLAAEGYKVAAFGDARSALAALEDGQRPFLILLDLMMPGMSGWEFRAAQLERAALASIPVVLVTAATRMLNHDGHALSGLEILRKPFDLDVLLALVDRYAGRARDGR